MYVQNLTNLAGWFLATTNSWSGHFVELHDFCDVIDNNANLFDTPFDIPHYQIPGVLEKFACLFNSEICEQESAHNYQKILDKYGVDIRNNAELLSNINELVLNKECIYAIITKCVTEDPKGVGLLYTAAESSLLDRCLFKLDHIRKMFGPNYSFRRREKKTTPSTEGDYWDYIKTNKLPEWIWCLVGNVIDEHPFGEDHTVVHGTRHFSPGTKVYCFPVQWGDGYEKIAVLGKHRGSRGLIRIVMSRELIHNFRCQKVFSPYVIKRIYIRNNHGMNFEGWGQSEADHETILSLLPWLNTTPEEEKQRSLLLNSSQLSFLIHVGDTPNQKIRLRIERHSRRDGCCGAGWYGFYRIGEKPEQSIGLLDWYGYWPDDVSYEECKSNYKPSCELLGGFLDAGILNWENTYESIPTNGRPPFMWEFEAISEHGSLSNAGHNAYPENFPSVMRLLTAWGFPKIWDSTSNTPDAFLDLMQEQK